ncbi:MAG: CDP-archaeol synthase [Patescibacteria group bacterium]|nr:CDP-archaeol synthase [Patescibacteria group bacterium]
MVQFILQCCWLLLPFGVANMSPVIFKGRLSVLARPIDNNHRFRGQPLFGDHKTWRGIILGTLTGGATFVIQQAIYQIPSFKYLSLIDYPSIPSHYGFVVGFGALFGDLIRAFVKRRIGVLPGQPWVPFDQIDYVLGGLAFSALYFTLSWRIWLVTLALGFFFHIAVSYIGFFLKMKESRW